MGDIKISEIDSEELWKDFRKTQPIEKIVKCWVCKEMLEIEFLELECPATGAVDVVRMDFCPKCGRRLK
ncbi:MAG: hypothetical protein M1510_10580 [Nitrospirae bacterium]|nr:hypothetical protein [Nitrospirota bacterium]MCL5238796.1 hypothetical protein [Nitrospirota bacterium]